MESLSNPSANESSVAEIDLELERPDEDFKNMTIEAILGDNSVRRAYEESLVNRLAKILEVMQLG
jgi:hypothetical protein